jgi:lysyl endopeptidase
MLKKSIAILFIASLFCRPALSQVEYSVGSIRGVAPESWYEISLDQEMLNELASSVQKKDDSYQFAIPVPVELYPSNSGCIIKEKGERIWLLGIKSKGAKSLNVILEPFNLPKGAYIYIYNSKKTIIRGAFTSDNNINSGLLPTMPVSGDELILECHFPEGYTMDGAIGVNQVAHDYLGILGNSESKDSRYGLSQPCNIDVNCSQGDNYSDMKRSVCRMIVNGIELCTGVMLNNTNQQNIPYLLTAQHCISSTSDAAKTIFVFNYESPWCDGPDSRVSHSLSGSTLKAMNETTDFSLVQLTQFPPLVYKPYLAGWDISGEVPLKSITIHHPQGDVKKISIDNDPAVSSSFGTFTTNAFWKILQWDAGTTEPGSSGAPMFDQNKRVTGILSGGDAICGRSVNDYFAKLSVSYSFNNEVDKQLKSWIDPSLSGVSLLNGRDPYSANNLTNDTLSNILSGETSSVTGYSLPGIGYSTGFNSDSITGYAEYFQNIKSEEIVEIWINIAKANYVYSADSMRLFVFADGAQPGQVLASKRFYLREAKDSFLMKMDFDQTIPVTGNFYVGWKLWYGSKALSETRQLAVFHSPDRFSYSLNSAWFLNNGAWKPFMDHPFTPGSMSLDVKVILTGNSIVNQIMPNSEKSNDFYIYPNPASTFITISSESEYQHLKCELFDLAGSKISSINLDNKFPGNYTLRLSQMPPGIYNLILSSDLHTESYKILKIN